MHRTARLALLLAALLTGPAGAQSCDSWPLRDAFLARFVQHDGRVIDYRIEPGITTSEGMAYSLFFALVADDRPQFQLTLDWIRAHLVDPGHTSPLPAWLWGKTPNGSWGIIDHNSATDADLWLAYTLLQAGRLWQRPDLARSGEQLLNEIATRMTRRVDEAVLLLPGPQGFDLGSGRWRTNPSYRPIQLMRFFASVDPGGPWQELARGLPDALASASPSTLAPDWFEYHAGSGWQIVPDRAPGAYEAIRVYLWAGMLDVGEPLRSALLGELAGIVPYWEPEADSPPEQVNVLTGEPAGVAPAGFAAALIPFFNALGRDDLIRVHNRRIDASLHDGLLGLHPDYYDQVLALFGLGWFEGRFRFGPDGTLLLPPAGSCFPR